LSRQSTGRYCCVEIKQDKIASKAAFIVVECKAENVCIREEDYYQEYQSFTKGNLLCLIRFAKHIRQIQGSYYSFTVSV